MNQETVNKILELMRSGMTQREAEAKLGISARTIGKYARMNGFKPDKAEQNRKGYEKYAAKQIELFGEKPKPFKPAERVTTSHVRLPPAEGYSSALYWFDDLENLNRKSNNRQIR